MEMTKGFHDDLNFRELGGYVTEEGKTIKTGMIFRSGGPYRMTKKEQEILKEKGIRYFLDLRTKEEVERKPDPEIEGITILHHSGVVSKGGEEIDFSPAGIFEIGNRGGEQLAKLTDYYTEMPFHNQAFQVMFDALLNKNVPILIHCASGKDRTGVAIMVLLYALGVDDETILRDYLLTNAYRRKNIERSLAANKEKIEQYPITEDLIRMREGVTEDIGRKVLREIHTRYPERKEFFRNEYGMTENDLEKLKDTYLNGKYE